MYKDKYFKGNTMSISRTQPLMTKSVLTDYHYSCYQYLICDRSDVHVLLCEEKNTIDYKNGYYPVALW